MRQSVYASLAYSFVFASQGALGFFPWDWREEVFGGDGISHETQTREAFDETAKEWFGIEESTSGMIAARELLCAWNAVVDKAEGQKYAEYHFDGEAFPEGQALVLDQLAETADHLKNGTDGAAIDSARRAFGQACHHVQDFYAHSNWIEMNGPQLNPLLYDESKRMIRNENTTTCQDCQEDDGMNLFCPDCEDNLLGTVLTSGYFPGDNRQEPKGVKKCQHGGLAQGTGDAIKGINKDSNECKWSPHYKHHFDAADTAKRATKEFLGKLKEKVSEAELRAFYGIGPSIGFAVDTTGSMKDVIAAVSDQLAAIVDDRLDNSVLDYVDEPSGYVLAPFDDQNKTDASTTFTSNPDNFKSALADLSTSGEEGCAEYSMSGLLSTIHKLQHGGYAFLITDAAPKDASRAQEVISAARAKDIRVFIFKFDGCSDSDEYSDVATQTGGVAWKLEKSKAANMPALVDHVARANTVSVLHVQKIKQLEAPFVKRGAEGAEQDYEIPVDSSLKTLTLSFSAQDDSADSLELYRPDGSLVRAEDEDVKFNDLGRGSVVHLDKPKPGNYRARIKTDKKHALHVTGQSNLRLSRADFVEHGGREGHQAFHPIDRSSPLPGSLHNLAAFVDGPHEDNSVSFEIQRRNGDKVADAKLKAGKGGQGQPPKNSFMGRARLPREQSHVVVKGKDHNGFRFQRIRAVPIFDEGDSEVKKELDHVPETTQPRRR